eukprot:TRINITY_DN21644_c0_g1_i1.p1 TRINITY_DN21644_c0_g1~~TRINITY_DN21644_c0_g1_i1.p1  ORF type:complete len:128 (+),score=24.60 TRINITY_DN21644_c0_g1_i1:414-797(+)
MDSWRLTLWAEKQGAGESLISAIGRRYFEEGLRLADHAMLLSAVEEAKLNTTAAQELLGSSAFQSEVLEHYRWAVEEQDIRSIPVFIISDPARTFRKAIHGSSSVDEFESILSEAASSQGVSCTTEL